MKIKNKIKKANKCKLCGLPCSNLFCSKAHFYEFKRSQTTDSEKLQRIKNSFAKYYKANREKILQSNRDYYARNKKTAIK